MTLNEAQEFAAKVRSNTLLAAPVRIISDESIDPIIDNDNGWDVEIISLEKE
jgi:hypothetical protein